MRASPVVASLLILAAASLAMAAPAQAEPITHLGIEFSDELGGFRLLSVSGTGTVDDPLTVVEEITEPQRHVILTIRGFGRHFGNRVGSLHLAGFAMRKIVHNRSDNVWRNYQMELREVTTRRSNYGDGLSFGQNSTLAETFAWSTYPRIQRTDEPEDSLGFSGAAIDPGESAEFRFIITDMSPVWQFYLVQIPLQPLSRQDQGGVNWAAR
ncbi:hypothetical protein A8950_2386 [Dongia mobilis]|uniref:Uncharacterized protein n=1 Tax=Dongia mobilis TaxID=578943 RepID=A0A4V3DEM8_9PROT|nr:hypothetical protein [Dongia mobilis]TDQ81321.1 hypothetical protein A8950_2386 [Dongia mobilis]